MVSTIAVAVVGALHLLFWVMESFLWTTPFGLKAFKMSPDEARATKVLAFNQGFYNAFLAAGLFWGAYSGDSKISFFFLSCVIIAGIIGGLSASKTILYIQALPAVVAIALVAGVL